MSTTYVCLNCGKSTNPPSLCNCLPSFGTALKNGGGGSALKHDLEKSRVDLVPSRALEEEGKVWGFGAKKYAVHNWRKGLSTLRICGAILRHLLAIMRGEDLDPESGIHHAAHIRCGAAMLIEFYLEGRADLDDRYKGAQSENK